jgi:hypothetical protein
VLLAAERGDSGHVTDELLSAAVQELSKETTSSPRLCSASPRTYLLDSAVQQAAELGGRVGKSWR